ncbi:hypothetical protein H4R33_002367 [Dimargaris cristalligena]|uniref:Uncharacterized protein n=1 Tax=Dimargaris cristalligena TaxID=215637 RepID=A0A4V1J4J6_9FUNG|nr:hypothetical protein H4R33_002367 [Dimargaris cristalligena]RKP35789.1 hypothetical protein BJ085DRAFT_35453 [Dimargaris cristalligena]|eukprot:RKP35789.1 hypothetical protein BJ085DRAFT_35453 [Dimargaris cristalligena]
MIAQYPSPVHTTKKPHFISRFLTKRLQSKRSASDLLAQIPGPMESRPSYATDAVTLSHSASTASLPYSSGSVRSRGGANHRQHDSPHGHSSHQSAHPRTPGHSFSLPRRFHASPSYNKDPAVVFTPSKQISRAGSPMLTPVDEFARISFDDLIDSRGQDVTIKFTLTPNVAK